MNRSADEIRKTNVEKMGAQLGEVYSALWQEVAVGHFYWKEYIELFGTKSERIELLNETAPHFFYMLQEELWESNEYTKSPFEVFPIGKHNTGLPTLSTGGAGARLGVCANAGDERSTSAKDDFSFQPPDQLTTPQSYRTAYRRCRQSTSIDQQPVEIADRNQHYGPVLVG
jgi:hypothetical protein